MNRTTVIIFSKDRALQLQGTLDSLRLYVTDSDHLRVLILYQASTTEYAAAYQQLRHEQAGKLKIDWIKEQNFKADLLRGLKQLSPNPEFVLFLVDDCLFVRSFSIKEITKALLGNPKSIGYSLRLGANTTFCYSENKHQSQPVFKETDDGLKFRWVDQEGDFGYPLEISSSLYRWEDLHGMLRWLPYTNPNRLEQQLSLMSPHWVARRPELHCAPLSLAFCAPINLVQTVFKNRAGISSHQSPEHLNTLYRDGWRINVEAISGYTPVACHEEIELPLHMPPKVQEAAANIAVVICTLPSSNPEWLAKALQSTAQGLQEGDEIFLLIDGGSLPEEQKGRLYEATAPIPLNVQEEPQHQGLAMGLNQLIDRVLENDEFTLIARMDSDDICASNRFALQRDYMKRNIEIDILGSWCNEIDEEGQLIQVKRVPAAHAGIVKCLPRRNVLNHPTVMMRREVFLSGLRYRSDVSKMEDYYLWIEAVTSGWQLANIPIPLLHFRRDQYFFRRRSGWRQAAAEVRVRWHAMATLNQWSPLNVATMIAAGALRILPAAWQTVIYRRRGAR